jgi:hypothetical protein
LTKGTQEYYDAIEAANEKARELIETYGLTQNDYHMDAEGIIKIDESVLDAKQEEYDARVLSTSTQLNLNKAEFERVSTENDIKDTYLDDSGTDMQDDSKMMLAKAAAEYGLNEAGVALSGDELKEAILQGLEGTDDYYDAKAYLDVMDEEGINTL